MNKLMLASLSSFLFFGACDPQVSFPVTIEGSTVVESVGIIGGFLGDISFGNLGGLDFDASQEFENNDARKENIRSLKVRSIEMSASDPEDANFDWLENIEFIAGAPDNPDIQVASGEPGNGVTSFQLQIADEELAEYAKSDRFSISTEGNGSPPPDDTTVDVTVIFDVVVGIGAGE